MNAIGTAASPATLTDDYADNTWVTSAKYLGKLHLDFDYTPKAGETDRYMYIRLRVSNDGGTSWRERTLRSNTTSESKVYQNTPYTFPGSKTSTGGTKYSGELDEEGINAELIQISVKEDSAGNHGTAYVGVTLTDNV